MIGLFRKVAPIFVVILFTLTASAYSDITFGGEIPWPLSVQHAVTVKNSAGLWKLEDKKKTRLYNVEMAADTRSGFDWIRVSELNPETYEVMTWGEGFFTPGKLPQIPKSSFSNVQIDVSGIKKDVNGRYISMFPNGDLTAKPYILRMVEVETSLGNVLGLSVIKYMENNFNHMLGTRVMKDPLACVVEKSSENLDCFLEF